MKIRNKKTGEIKNVNHNHILMHFNDGETKCINSLAELNDEWEDYEEPKCYWFINTHIHSIESVAEDYDGKEKDEEIGNYFETKEEAEKAVEKLKAWKRLKEGGFEFKGWNALGEIRFDIGADNKVYSSLGDLDLLFGGEE